MYFQQCSAMESLYNDSRFEISYKFLDIIINVIDMKDCCESRLDVKECLSICRGSCDDINNFLHQDAICAKYVDIVRNTCCTSRTEKHITSWAKQVSLSLSSVQTIVGSSCATCSKISLPQPMTTKTHFITTSGKYI